MVAELGLFEGQKRRRGAPRSLKGRSRVRGSNEL